MSTMLSLKSRPVVRFDVSKPEHRQIFFTFLKTNSWTHSPYRFYLEDGYLDLPSQMYQWIATYYLGNEFDPVKAKKKTVKRTKAQE